MVDKGGSRKVIRSLVTALGRLFEELVDVCGLISPVSETGALRKFVPMSTSVWQLQRTVWKPAKMPQEALQSCGFANTKVLLEVQEMLLVTLKWRGLERFGSSK